MSLCVGFFTANALLIKYLGSRLDIDVWSLVFTRGVVGLLFVALCYGKQGSLQLGRVFLRPLLILRGMIGAVGLICYYWTIPPLGVGVATLISTTYVVFGAILATRFFVHEPLSLSQLMWLMVSLIGIALLTDARAGFTYPLGIAVLGAVAAGVVIVLIRHLHATEASPTIFAAQCVYGVLFSSVFAFPELLQLRANQWGWAIVAGLLSACGQLAMTQAFRHLSVSVGGAFHLSVPVWVAMGGWLLFDERLGTLQFVGAALVMFGCYRAIVPAR